MIVVCEICGQEIAETTPEELGLPLTGDMFRSHRAGYPSPFLGNVDWEWMRCRWCATRPFLDRDTIKTTNGYHKVAGEPEAPEEEFCQQCGKVESDFKNRSGFVNHCRKCRGLKNG